jgi:CubicO group peptidase (beta-lactamase class C family)
MSLSRLFILAALLFSLSCKEDKNPLQPSVYPLAEEQNINSTQLEQAYNAARSDGGVLSLIVARNNVVVADEYFIADRTDTTNNIRSVTKSVLSALIGIAIDKGFINSIDDEIGPYLKIDASELDDEKDKITIKQLLTMSAGFPWQELDATATDYVKWVKAGNQVDYVLALPLVNLPETVFTYNSGASHLLSVILEHATGKSAYKFAREFLFQSLGINRSLVWSVDQQEYYNGSSTLRLGPHEMLKIGQLFLNNGLYNGKQIISSIWVVLSTQTHINTSDAVPFGTDYGFLWWIGSTNGRDFYFANGWGGQFILNVPDLNLTIVAQSDWVAGGRPAHEQWWNTINIIMNQILPAVND